VRKALASPLVRNIVTLVTGTGLAQAIPLLSAPIIGRLYSPDQVGDLGYFLAFAAVAAVPATGRYEMAVLLPKDDTKAYYIAYGATGVATLFSLCALLAVAGYEVVLQLMHQPPYAEAWMLPLALWQLAVLQVVNYFFVRHNAYRAAVWSKLSQTGGTALFSIAFGLLGLRSGLVFGAVLGGATAVLMSWWLVRNTQSRPPSLNMAKVRTMLWEYREYPTLNALPATLDSASLQLPVVAIKSFFGSHSAGLFSVNRQVIGGPLSIISSSVSQVLFRQLMELKHAGQALWPLVVRMLAILSAIALVAAGAVWLLSDWVFVFVFGTKWAGAAPVAKVLVAGLVIKFAISPLSVVFPVTGRLKRNAVWQGSYFGSLCLLFFARNMPFLPFLGLFTGIEVALYAIYLALIYGTLRKK